MAAKKPAKRAVKKKVPAKGARPAKRVSGSHEAPPAKRLYRSGRERMLGGVCGGIGEYLGVDPTIIRILWILLSLAYGTGILLYIILWIIIPRNPRHRWD